MIICFISLLRFFRVHDTRINMMMMMMIMRFFRVYDTRANMMMMMMMIIMIMMILNDIESSVGRLA